MWGLARQFLHAGGPGPAQRAALHVAPFTFFAVQLPLLRLRAVFVFGEGIEDFRADHALELGHISNGRSPVLSERVPHLQSRATACVVVALLQDLRPASGRRGNDPHRPASELCRATQSLSYPLWHGLSARICLTLA